MSNILKTEKGFTLIEIVLVLAIAGLLLVVVFLAVGGAQRSRRDAQRSSDVARVAAVLETYASNTDGAYPGNQNKFNLALTGPYKVANANDPLTGSVYTYLGLAAPVSGTSAGLSYTLTGRIYKVCISLEQGQKCVTNK